MTDVLTTRQLNRTTIARQLLRERALMTPAQVIEHLVGMQAQWPRSPYIGLWSRASDFRRDELEREIITGSVLKATVMRMTLHLVSRSDYALLCTAFRGTNHLHETDVARRLAPEIRALAVNASLTRAEAIAYLEREHGLTGQEANEAWRGARVRAHVLHHHETALWAARPEARFAAVDEPEDADPIEARAEMVRRYLAAFGPASKADLRAWSMMRMSDLAPAIARLEPLGRYRDEHGRELLDVPDAPLVSPETELPVRFLPKWDNVLLAYTDRTRVLPERYRRTVIKMNGDVAQTFLVDGFVAGTWRLDGGAVMVDPFELLSRAQQRDVEDEAARFASFLSA